MTTPVTDLVVEEMWDFTREFYRLPVNFTVAGVALDPTILVVEFAVISAGSKPISTDWVTGSWEAGGGFFWARALVGDALADHVITAPNLYDVFFRLTANPERPARLVGQIQAK